MKANDLLRPAMVAVRRRPGAAAAAVWFVLVIAAPLAAFVAGVRPVPGENRAVAAAPELAVGRAFDTDLYGEVAAWFEDRLPGRDHAVEADAWIDYRVFGDSPNPDVSLGADGWLYLTRAVRAPCITSERAEAVAAEVDRIARIGAAAGVDVVLIVAPNKAAIHPEHLGGLADREECAAANRALLRDALAGSSAFVDTWAALEDAGTGERLYHRTDTHWNRLGASYAAGAVVERLAPGLWDQQAVVRTGTQQRLGDLVKLMGLSFTEEVSAYRVRRGRDPAVERVPTDGGPEAVESAMTGLPVVPGRTVVIHDSMGEVIVPLLRPYLEEAVTVRTRAGSSFGTGGAWFAGLLGDADLLVFQTVERDLVDRFDGTVVSDVVGALAARLPRAEIDVGAPFDLVGTDDRFLVVTGTPGTSVSVATGGSEITAEVGPVGTAVVDLTGVHGAGVVEVAGTATGVVLVTVP